MQYGQQWGTQSSVDILFFLALLICGIESRCLRLSLSLSPLALSLSYFCFLLTIRLTASFISEAAFYSAIHESEGPSSGQGWSESTSITLITSIKLSQEIHGHQVSLLPSLFTSRTLLLSHWHSIPLSPSPSLYRLVVSSTFAFIVRKKVTICYQYTSHLHPCTLYLCVVRVIWTASLSHTHTLPGN